MTTKGPKSKRIMMDLEKLNTYNAKGCPACGHKFSLGDIAVVACGAWDGGATLIHEHEAVYDPIADAFVERRCFNARGGSA